MKVCRSVPDTAVIDAGRRWHDLREAFNAPWWFVLIGACRTTWSQTAEGVRRPPVDDMLLHGLPETSNKMLLIFMPDPSSQTTQSMPRNRLFPVFAAAFIFFLFGLQGCGLMIMTLAEKGARKEQAKRDIADHEKALAWVQSLTESAAQGNDWSRIALATNTLKGFEGFKGFDRETAIGLLRTASGAQDAEAANYAQFTLGSYFAGLDLPWGQPLLQKPLPYKPDIEQGRQLLTALARSRCLIYGYGEPKDILNPCTQVANTYLVGEHANGDEALAWYLFGRDAGKLPGRNAFHYPHLPSEWRKQRRLAAILDKKCFSQSRYDDPIPLDELNAELGRISKFASIKFSTSITMPPLAPCVK